MKKDLSDINVTVIGDSMLDRYVLGTYSKQAQEEVNCSTYDQSSIVRCLGAAANVAANVVALGAKASLVTLLGDDIPGRRIYEGCRERGIILVGIKELPLTTMKSRFMVDGQQVFRWDQGVTTNGFGNRRAIADLAWRAAEDYDANVVILSDYAKGFFSSDPYDQVNDLVRHDIKDRYRVFADPKPANATGYHADVYTPNEVEALELLAAETNYHPAHGRKLCELLAASVAVTRGSMGVEAYINGADGGASYPAHCQAPVCVVGAGDTFIATLAVAMAAGEDYHEAVRIANVAAGIAVSKPYTAVVTRRELDGALEAEKLSRSDIGLAAMETDRGGT